MSYATTLLAATIKVSKYCHISTNPSRKTRYQQINN